MNFKLHLTKHIDLCLPNSKICFICSSGIKKNPSNASIIPRCTRGVRVVSSRTRMSSSNSVRMYKSNFTAEKIVWCTHESV